jgi:hypothetical protein
MFHVLHLCHSNFLVNLNYERNHWQCQWWWWWWQCGSSVISRLVGAAYHKRSKCVVIIIISGVVVVVGSADAAGVSAEQRKRSEQRVRGAPVPHVVCAQRGV